jgi:hypothetical protein
VEWFFSAKDTLPRERFTYDRGEGWQVIWATPAASYQNLAAEIEKGPGGQWDAEVRSILEQLHNLFGNTPLPYISRAARDRNRPGSATRAKLSFSFEKIEA